MADDMYDEFGNYIGPELEDDDEDLDGQQPAFGGGRDMDQDVEKTDAMRVDDEVGGGGGEEGADNTWRDNGLSVMHVDEPTGTAIVLHEDKKYYPTAEEVYGPGVETLVQDEDTQPLSVPIVAPVKKPKTYIQEKNLPETKFSKE
ncbi:hypothetical protein HK101_010863 [Irineochytrium annulatum]|nr:hypothetical protein HK101_010863 [Irineochytrium annulatum]